MSEIKMQSLRKRIFGTAYISLSFFLLCGCSPQQDDADESPGPDLIVVNADVHTVDSSMPNAEAFAIADGKFVAVGSTAEIRQLAGDNTEVIDVAGVTIIPGLIDGHTHLLMGSGLAVGVDLSEIEEKSDWLGIIRDKAENTPEGSWIL